MKTLKQSLIILVFLGLPVAAAPQSQTDVDAINRLLERYRETQIADEMLVQGELMAKDRVWVDNTVGRRTDNVENMRLQQSQVDNRRKIIPGLIQQIEDRDKLIKFYGDGKVAVVTFFRYATFLFPPGTPPEVKKEYEPSSEWIMLVLEKRNGKWLIVSTHV